MRQSWRVWDFKLGATAIALGLISGIVMVSAAATVNPGLAIRHAIWIGIGVVLSLGVAQVNYRRWADTAWLGYVLSMGILALVPVSGAMRLGATRWLSLWGLSVQPSELAKLATVWILARYLAGRPVPLSARSLAGSALLAGLPALLVFLQPDLGSASILVAIWLGMVWMAGVSSRLLTLLSVGVTALSPLAWHALKDYQRDRLMAFLNPHADPLGTGYTIIQSVIAIGSGKLWGKGWFAGTQNQLSFLPERHSDFIFSVVGEEWGFLGCLLVLVLLGALLLRVLQIAAETSDPHGRLFAVGVFSWLGYQALVNMGMVMGLLPVVGVPLPLISYGGSSMIMLWIALGMVQSVHRDTRL